MRYPMPQPEDFRTEEEYKEAMEDYEEYLYWKEEEARERTFDINDF